MLQPIQPSTAQVLSYRNGFLRGRCQSEACVVVTWGSGFVQSMPAAAWNARSFLSRPNEAREVVDLEELARAQSLFDRQRASCRAWKSVDAR